MLSYGEKGSGHVISGYKTGKDRLYMMIRLEPILRLLNLQLQTTPAL
jgi:hypothetical protein